MFDINFTTTACIRPDLVELTYKSFSENLSDLDLKKYTLFINIDPAPLETKYTAKDVIDVSSKYFGQVISNTPQSPNFCKAIKWLWSQPKSQFVFHIEDDWRLMRSIKVSEILECFIKNPSFYQVRLNKNPAKKSATSLYGLSPCVISRKFYSIISAKLNPDRNPERQLRKTDKWGISLPSKTRVCAFPKKEKIIEDIGRLWREERGLLKHSDEEKFVKWDKI